MNEKNIDLLKNVRKRLHLTQEEMGNRLDVDRNYIYMMESGKKPVSSKTIRKLNTLNSEQFTEPKNIEHVKMMVEESHVSNRTSSDYEKEINRLHAVIENMQNNLNNVTESLVTTLKIICDRNREDDEKKKRDSKS